MSTHTCMQRALAALAALLVATGCSAARGASARATDWPAYGNDPGASRWSPLHQIDRSNVSRLHVAWTYRTGEVVTGTTRHVPPGLEATPILVDNTLYFDTPYGRVIALDPARGTAKWTFDPKVDIHGGYGDFTSRGVSTWLDAGASPSAPCRRRIYVATIDARLIALDGATGKPCAAFGSGGTVDLRKGVRNGISEFAEYEETSPPAVVNGLVIVGSGVADNVRRTAPSGVVRAFDARTGALRWSWDPIPQDPSDPAYATWRGPKAHETGAANAWSVITTDSLRDLVFVPTGSASPDYFGGERLGQNLYANSVVAIRASTGKVVWHFQVVHHDLWDYDVPAPPTLMTVHRDGRDIPAVVVTTKIGHVFILNRETGEPLFPVEERPVPASDVPGEEAWPTQPVPTLPRPLVPQRVTPDDVYGITEADRKWCREQLASLRSEGVFTPPSVKGTLVIPGNVGGSNWGGVAVDQARGLIIAPANNLPAVMHLVPRGQYQTVRDTTSSGELAPQIGTPYALWRDFFLSPSRIPCIKPPWGTLTAIDAATGQVRWKVPLGGPLPWAKPGTLPPDAGSPNLGGAMVTAGGLVFIGATFDSHFRAFDVETGKLLWTADLPVSGKATPMTYRAANGKQYVVIAAGGQPRTGLPLGDYLIAYAIE